MNYRWLRHGLVAASILTYALLQHYANTTPGAAALGAGLAITPLLITWLLLARRTPWPRIGVLLASLLAAALLAESWSRIEHSFPLMFMLQEAGVYLILAFGFGRSLMSGQTPLCTHWATRIHGPLSEPVERYTRAVTLAWTVFFVAISLTSVLLYAFAALRVWSIFSNFLTLPLVALMFAIEYEVRRHRLPWMQRASLADTARAYFATTTRGRPI
ncbi:MAG TPA: hypothetical protein VNZ06_03940 [Steroidobacteraceae bacterium]|nr:hypothetical protein [Steroidobacteraceae bacterium]